MVKSLWANGQGSVHTIDRTTLNLKQLGHYVIMIRFALVSDSCFPLGGRPSNSNNPGMLMFPEVNGPSGQIYWGRLSS